MNARRIPAIPATLVVAVATVLLAGCGGQTTTDDDRPAAVDPPAPAAPVDAPVDQPVESQPEPTLDDVPLAAGWPDHAPEPEAIGTELPVERLTADFADYACPSSPQPDPGRADVLRGQYSSVEDYRTRELVVLPDADAAVAWVEALEDHYAACPAVTEDGLRYPLTVLETATGGQSFGVVRSTEHDGQPAIGLSTLHVVRVGRSVLLDTSSGEGWAPDPEADGRRVLDRMATAAAEVIAAMCRFTAAGCGDPS